MTVEIRPINGVVPGIFTDRANAESALSALRDIGFSEDELGVIVPDPATHILIDDSTHEALLGVREGMAIGIPLGALAGIALVALAAPGLGVIGIGGALLLGGPIGALWGGIGGGYLGLTTEIHHLEDVERKYEVALAPGELLIVVVTDPDRADAVCEIMRSHGARCIRESVAKSSGTSLPAD